MPATRATLVTELIRTAWYDRCQLSTLITIKVWFITADHLADLGTVTYCERCKGEVVIHSVNVSNAFRSPLRVKARRILDRLADRLGYAPKHEETPAETLGGMLTDLRQRIEKMETRPAGTTIHYSPATHEPTEQYADFIAGVRRSGNVRRWL